MKTFVCAAAFLLMLPAASSAQNSIDGSWAGQIDTDAGPQPIQFVMRTDVEKVSGSIIGGGSEMGIKEGTLSGNTLTFTSEQRSEGTVLPIACTGTVSVDTINVSCTAEGQTEAKEFVITRQQP
jgi:hypothetical protein